MAVQLQKIQLNYATYSSNNGNVSGYVKDINHSKIAELLGMKIDPETNIIYMGDDNTTGFLIDGNDPTATSISTKIYLKGEIVMSQTAITVNSYPTYLYYVKSDNGCIFGINNGTTMVLDYMCSKGINMIDGTDVWGYAALNRYASNNLVCMYTDKGNSQETPNCDNDNVANDLLVTLVPFVSIPDNAVFEHIFIQIAGLKRTSSYGYEMNGKTYYVMRTMKETHPKVVLEL